MAPIIPGEDQRVSYLRILDDQFSLMATTEVDWNVYTANLLILENGTYIQSSSPPDEKYLYFQKLELVEKNHNIGCLYWLGFFSWLL